MEFNILNCIDDDAEYICDKLVEYNLSKVSKTQREEFISKCSIASTLSYKRPCSHDLFAFLICSGNSGDHGKSFSRKLLSVSS